MNRRSIFRCLAGTGLAGLLSGLATKAKASTPSPCWAAQYTADDLDFLLASYERRHPYEQVEILVSPRTERFMRDNPNRFPLYIRFIYPVGMPTTVGYSGKHLLKGTYRNATVCVSQIMSDDCVAFAQKDAGPIKWNPYNKVVQDHRDGVVNDRLTNIERAKRGLPTPWTTEIAEVEIRQPAIM